MNHHAAITVVTIPPAWTDVIQAIGAILVPLVVAILAYRLTRNQSRSEAIVQARLEYYKALAPDLNRLMCYITFIGGWRDDSPGDIVKLKRRLDTNFYCAVPLFSKEVLEAYNELMALSFSTFSSWGIDAQINSNAYRRRQSWRGQGHNAWQPDWDQFFKLPDSAVITRDSLAHYRETYDRLLAVIVRDIDLTRARSQYTTDLVSLNAHAPRVQDVFGSAD